MELIRQEKPDLAAPDITAGLSLGEYTALYAAGALSFEDALTLVRKRGLAMQQAADNSEGTMVSILGMDAEQIHTICTEAAEGELLVAANFNCPGQTVISGSIAACQRAAKIAEQKGALKAIQLQVAGAFHSDMMTPAADALKIALDETSITLPQNIKVIANITADYYQTAEQISQGLVKQLVQPILWQKSMEKLLADGVDDFYEIGPGRVLTGLMKKINRKTKVKNISNLAAYE